MATRIQVVIDCADPDGLAGFWAQALGYHKQDPPQGYASWPAFETAQGVPQDRLHAWHAVVDPDGAGPRLYFHRVPEAKVGKNRLHLDLNVAREVLPEQSRDRIDGEAERLGRLGATRLRAVEEHGEYWVTMLDPEGNEFDLMETASASRTARVRGDGRSLDDGDHDQDERSASFGRSFSTTAGSAHAGGLRSPSGPERHDSDRGALPLIHAARNDANRRGLPAEIVDSNSCVMSQWSEAMSERLAATR